MRDRETERQRDRETEGQRKTEKDRERQRKTSQNTKLINLKCFIMKLFSQI